MQYIQTVALGILGVSVLFLLKAAKTAFKNTTFQTQKWIPIQPAVQPLQHLPI